MPDFTLDPKDTALVLIEYQNEFTSEGGKLYPATKDVLEKTGMLENSTKLLDFCREKGVTVIHAPISFEPGHSEIGTNPYGILAGVKDSSAFEVGTVSSCN